MSEVNHLDKTKRYADQRELHLEFMQKHLTVESDSVWVDLGCGLGELLENMGDGSVWKYGLDQDPECVEITREHVPSATVRVGDVEDSPYPDDFANLSTSLFVLEHVENPTAHVRDALRITKKGGRFIVATPNIGRPQRLWYAVQKKERFERSGHRQGYDHHLLYHLLTYNGWKVEKILTRFVDCPFYNRLPKWFGDYMSKNLLLTLFPNVGSELFAFCRKEDK